MYQFDLDAEFERRVTTEDVQAEPRKGKRAEQAPKNGPSFAAQNIPPWDPLSGQIAPWGEAIPDPLSGEALGEEIGEAEAEEAPAPSPESARVLEGMADVRSGAYRNGMSQPSAQVAQLLGEESEMEGAQEEAEEAPQAAQGSQRGPRTEQNDTPPLPAREQDRTNNRAHAGEADDASPLPAREQERVKAHPGEQDDAPADRSQERDAERPQESLPGESISELTALSGEGTTAPPIGETMDGAPDSGAGAMSGPAAPESSGDESAASPENSNGQPEITRAGEAQRAQAQGATPVPPGHNTPQQETAPAQQQDLPQALQAAQAAGVPLQAQGAETETETEEGAAGEREEELAGLPEHAEERAEAQGETAARLRMNLDIESEDGRALLAKEVARLNLTRESTQPKQSHYFSSQSEGEANACVEDADGEREAMARDAERAGIRAVGGEAMGMKPGLLPIPRQFSGMQAVWSRATDSAKKAQEALRGKLGPGAGPGIGGGRRKDRDRKKGKKGPAGLAGRVRQGAAASLAQAGGAVLKDAKEALQRSPILQKAGKFLTQLVVKDIGKLPSVLLTRLREAAEKKVAWLNGGLAGAAALLGQDLGRLRERLDLALKMIQQRQGPPALPGAAGPGQRGAQNGQQGAQQGAQNGQQGAQNGLAGLSAGLGALAGGVMGPGIAGPLAGVTPVLGAELGRRFPSGRRAAVRLMHDLEKAQAEWGQFLQLQAEHVQRLTRPQPPLLGEGEDAAELARGRGRGRGGAQARGGAGGRRRGAATPAERALREQEQAGQRQAARDADDAARQQERDEAREEQAQQAQEQHGREDREQAQAQQTAQERAHAEAGGASGDQAARGAGGAPAETGARQGGQGAQGEGGQGAQGGQGEGAQQGAAQQAEAGAGGGAPGGGAGGEAGGEAGGGAGPGAEAGPGAASAGGGGGGGGAKEAAGAPAAPAAGATAKETFDNFAQSTPSEQAYHYTGFGGNLTQSVQQEDQALNDSLPELSATMGEEPQKESRPAAQVQPQQAQLNTAPSGAPQAKPDLTPTDPGKAQKAPPVSLPANEKGTPAPESVQQAVRSIPTKDGNIQVSPSPRPKVQLTGQNDPQQTAQKRTEAMDQAGKAREDAQQKIRSGPGPEKVQPIKVEEKHQVKLEVKPEAYQTAQLPAFKEYQGYGLPKTVQDKFDELHKPAMEQAMQGAKDQLGKASAERDQKRDQEIKGAQDKVKAENEQAQRKQTEEVSKARGKITAEKEQTQSKYQAEYQKLDSETRSKQEQKSQAIKQRAAEDQARIDGEFQRAEQQAKSEVDRGERQAAEEKRRAEEESRNRSWWDRAVDFVTSALEALAGLVTQIFDAVRSVVAGILDAAKQLANTLIDAACQFIQAAIREFGDWLKSAVTALLGSVFPELARQLNEFIDRAVDAACQAVNAIADRLKEAVNALVDSLKGALDAIIGAFKAAVQTAVALARAVLTGNWAEVAKMALEAVLRLAGVDPAEFYSVMGNVVDTIKAILQNPGGFIGNLIRAGAQGFRQFAGNFLQHLQAGFIQWITGVAGEAGIQMPIELSAGGIFSLVAQVLGLSFENLKNIVKEAVRKKGARGARVAAMMDQAEEIAERVQVIWARVQEILNGGWGALWGMIEEYLGGLYEEVIGGIRNFLMQRIVMAAVQKLATMWNPVGAIVQAVITAWNMYQWLRDNLSRIMGVVRAIFESINQIVQGNIGPAANKVEQTLARLVPVAIDLLAGIIGIGGIGGRVREIIERIRGRIQQALQRVADKLVDRFWSLVERIGNRIRGGGQGQQRPGQGQQRPGQGQQQPGQQQPGQQQPGQQQPGQQQPGTSSVEIPEIQFTDSAQHPHRLYMVKNAQAAQLMVASTPTPVVDIDRPDSTFRPAQGRRQSNVVTLAKSAERKAEQAWKIQSSDAAKADRLKNEAKIIMDRVKAILATYGGARNLEAMCQAVGGSALRKWRQLQAEASPEARAVVPAFIAACDRRLEADHGLMPLAAMQAEVRANQANYILKGPPIDEAAIRQQGGCSRIMDLPSVFNYYLPAGEKAKFASAADFASQVNAGTYDPLPHLTGQIRGGLAEAWWFAHNSAGGTTAAELKKQLTLTDPAYDMGCVRLDFSARDAVGTLGLRKPTVFDGMVQGNERDPMWATSPNKTWGLTRDGVLEGVAPPVDARAATRKTLVRGRGGATRPAGATDGKTVAARGTMAGHPHTLTVDPKKKKVTLASVEADAVARVDHAMREVDKALAAIKGSTPADAAQKKRKEDMLKELRDIRRDLKALQDKVEDAAAATADPALDARRAVTMQGTADGIMNKLEAYGQKYGVKDLEDVGEKGVDFKSDEAVTKIAEEVVQARLDKLYPAWEKDAVDSGYKEKDGSNEKIIWEKYKIKPDVQQSAAKKAKEDFVKVVVNVKDIANVKGKIEEKLSEERDNFQPKIGEKVADDVKAYGVGEAVKNDTKNEIRTKVQYRHNSAMGKIETPASKEQADQKLMDAVRAAGGIVAFMKGMASAKAAGGLTKGELDTLCAATGGENVNFEWLKNQFRAADKGKHEWIPTNLIIQVIERAANVTDFVEGEDWIDLQHELRTDSEHVIFKHEKTKVTMVEPSDGETYAVLQGHSGAVDLAGTQQIKSQADFHNELRAVFNNPSIKTVKACVAGLRKVFKDWVWDGTMPATPLHPDLHLKAHPSWKADSGTAPPGQKSYFDQMDQLFEKYAK